MTFTEFSVSDAISAIEKSLPAPENPFERAKYFLNLKWIGEELSLYYAKEYTDSVEELKNEPSDEYCVVELSKMIESVDIDKLRKTYPDVYERIVFVKSNVAEKILSRRTLYELCAEKIGLDAVRKYDVINKGDLKNSLLYDEIGQFIVRTYEPAGLAVREKGADS